MGDEASSLLFLCMVLADPKAACQGNHDAFVDAAHEVLLFPEYRQGFLRHLAGVDDSAADSSVVLELQRKTIAGGLSALDDHDLVIATSDWAAYLAVTAAIDHLALTPDLQGNPDEVPLEPRGGRRWFPPVGSAPGVYAAAATLVVMIGGWAAIGGGRFGRPAFDVVANPALVSVSETAHGRRGAGDSAVVVEASADSPAVLFVVRLAPSSEGCTYRMTVVNDETDRPLGFVDGLKLNAYHELRALFGVVPDGSYRLQVVDETKATVFEQRIEVVREDSK
jgi:hypothetical protein